MKIAIASDFHLGFGKQSERYNESFENAEAAMKIALRENADLLLVPGDLFDSAVPSPEDWVGAFRLFQLSRNAEKRELKITWEKRDRPGEGKEEARKFSGLPVIAIHGTHEFRSRDYKNALAVLDAAGCLVYLHAETAVIEKEGERVSIHGLGGVPEKKALDVLRAWNPEPKNPGKNLLVLHQSLKEYLPTDDEMSVTISLSDLPPGFDLMVNGHFHMAAETEASGSRLLMPGSTIITQMKKNESGKPKGVFIYDSGSGQTAFHPLPNQRKLYYHRLDFKDTSPDAVLGELENALKADLEGNHGLKPLVRFRLFGSLAKGISQSDVSFEELERNYSGKAIISIEKNFFSQSFRKKISELRELQKSRASVAQMGVSILEKNLEETGFAKAFDVRRLFELLADGRLEDAERVLVGESKNRKDE